MKRYIVMIFLIFFTFSIFSEAEPITVKRFLFGDNINQFGYEEFSGVDNEGPSAINFDNKGNLYIVDFWKSRIVIFDLDYNNIIHIINNSDISLSTHFEIEDNGNLIGNYLKEKIHKVDKEENTIFSIDTTYIRNRQTEFWTRDNVVFSYNSDDELIAFLLFKENSIIKIKEILNHTETIQFLKKQIESKKNPYFNAITIDHNGYILEKGELVTRIFKDYINYWIDKNKKKKRPANSMDLTDSYLKELTNMRFLGVDKKRNVYWRAGKTNIFIFNMNGWLIESIEFDRKQIKTYPAIHPSGDVFFLDYDSEEIHLYKISNTWDPFLWSPPTEEQADNITYGTLTANGVRVRQEPNLRAKPLGFMGKDNRVEILDQTAEVMKIGKMESVWYKVRRLSDGLEGWVYGWFVKIEAP